MLTKSKWILQHIDLIKTKTKLITTDTVLYLGEPLSLVIQPIMTGKQSIKIETNEIRLLIKDPKKRDDWLDSLLKIHTTSFVESILPDWIQKTGLTPKHVRYRKMKKWGACTKNGTLVFNSYLICLPPALIHYIVCHELVHLLHFDHSQNFHASVATFLPHVKKLEKDLKMYVR